MSSGGMWHPDFDSDNGSNGVFWFFGIFFAVAWIASLGPIWSTIIFGAIIGPPVLLIFWLEWKKS